MFTNELPIFLREHMNGMYRTDVYFLSKTLAEFPIYVVFPATLIGVPYFIIGFNGAVERFFCAVAIIILAANVTISFGEKKCCLI